jgi:uncharacterized membrane-anchored protein YhcB (DUF1043 family)
MKKIITLSTTILLTVFAIAQTPDSISITTLQQQVSTLQIELKNQKNDFSKRISSANEQIKSLQNNVEILRVMFFPIIDSLGLKINETAANAETQIAVLKTHNRASLWWSIIGGIALLLLSVGLFLWLYLKRKADSASIVRQLENQKSAIETRLVKEYSLQAEVLENLMKTIRELPVSTADSGEPDHSLALKLADEITLMERNLSLMDSNTKGLKQLNRSIGNLKDNLIANGYEIPELLGKPYNEGLKCHIINTIQDDNLKQGVQIISKIIKPQVNYQDKMIQVAQIEVSVGENINQQLI